MHRPKYDLKTRIKTNVNKTNENDHSYRNIQIQQIKGETTNTNSNEELRKNLQWEAWQEQLFDL